MKIRDGKYPTNQYLEDIITLSLNIIIPKENLTDLINFIYPNLEQNSENINYLVNRTILTLMNVNVKKISDIVMDRLPDDPYIYTSTNSVDLMKGQSQLYSPEFLRSLQIPRLSSDELKLKVEVLIILLQNLNPSEDLCNRTRLICRSLQNKVIDA